MDLVMAETYKCKGEVSALHKIKEIAHKYFTKEICGFLGYDYENKEFIIQLEDNASDDPRSYFLINPLSYLMFKDSYAMVAVFHSHIMGDEKESEFDVKMSDNCCQPFLIYSLNTKKINIYTPKTIEADVNILERIKAVK
jgi:proteasome lid subunit RPN8/RPN11|tara:strand:- start:5794 stop:6213 length:420 start_codon:yes stop_codon:yes gene_type:complete